MEIKVRAVDGPDQKSKAEIEEELLKKHEDQFVDSEKKEEAKEEVKEESKSEEPEKREFTDEDVLSHINERYGKTISSVDELFEEREKSPELPEDVSAFFNYKKETGRDIKDFVELQRNYEDMDPDDLLARYYKAKDAYLDKEDIAIMIEDFDYDDLDEEKDIKKKKLAKKKAVSEAINYFNEEKEKYKIPLESRKEELNPQDAEDLKAYRDELQRAKSNDEKNKLIRDRFVNRTDELLSDEFKGFKFKVGELEFSYKPAEASTLKKKNVDLKNLIDMFTDDSGEIDDIEGYHKALAIATYPDRFAKFFYEQGQADAVTNSAKKSKNVDFEQRRVPEISNTKNGLQIKNVTRTSDGNRLRIRKRK